MTIDLTNCARIVFKDVHERTPFVMLSDEGKILGPSEKVFGLAASELEAGQHFYMKSENDEVWVPTLVEATV